MSEIFIPTVSLNLYRARYLSEATCWLMLMLAKLSSPQGLYLECLLQATHAVYGDASELELKRELESLEARGLVSIARDEIERLFVTATRRIEAATTDEVWSLLRAKPKGSV